MTELDFYKRLLKLSNLCNVNAEEKKIEIICGPKSHCGDALAELDKIADEYDMSEWEVNLVKEPIVFSYPEKFLEAVRRALIDEESKQ